MTRSACLSGRDGRCRRRRITNSDIQFGSRSNFANASHHLLSVAGSSRVAYTADPPRAVALVGWPVLTRRDHFFSSRGFC